MRRSGSNYKLHSSFLYHTGSLLLNCMKTSAEAVCFPCFPYHCVSGFCACVPDGAGVLWVFTSEPFPSDTFIFSCACYSTQYNSPVFVLRWSPYVAVFIEAFVCLPILQPSQDCNGGSSPRVERTDKNKVPRNVSPRADTIAFSKGRF